MSTILCFGVAVAAAIVVGLTPQIAAASDGIAVGVMYRSAMQKSIIAEANIMGGYAQTIGKIVKYTIKNDAVAQCDTIYKQTWARSPVLSPDGSRVAFIRFDAQTVGVQLLPGGGKMHLSIMDIDGRNVHDIMSFTTSSGDLGRIDPDWPSGEWLYYLSPNYSNGYEVCKVKPADSTSRQSVFAYGQIRFSSWSISIDQSKAVIVSAKCVDPRSGYDSKDWCIIPHTFPPSSEPGRGNLTPDCFSGCMATMLCSGTYYEHFYSDTHDKFRINSWAPPSQCLSGTTVLCTDMAAMLGATTQTTGCLLEGVRGSTNSDKWVCVEGYAKTCFNDIGRNGSVLMLVNWVDKKTIMLSGHRLTDYVSDTQPVLAERPGDYWVAGGPVGCYQNSEGTWTRIPGFVKSSVPQPQRIVSASHASLRRMLVTDQAGHVRILLVPARHPPVADVYFRLDGKATQPRRMEK